MSYSAENSEDKKNCNITWKKNNKLSKLKSHISNEKSNRKKG